MSIDLDKYFLPYQKSWIRCDAPLAIGEKSRRIGWTYCDAARGVIRRLEKGTDLFHSSADLTAAREYMDDCQLFARIANVVAEDLGLQVIDEKDGIHAFVLRFENGAKIVAGSSNPKFFRSKGGDANGDEFAFHSQPRELVKAMHATAMVWGHQMRLWSTHNGEGSLFNTLVKAGRKWMVARGTPGGEGYVGLKADVSRVTIFDAVDQGLVEKIKKLDKPDHYARRAWLEELRSTVPDEDTWKEEYLCQPSSEASSLLTYDLLQACERDGSELKLVTSPEQLESDGIFYAGYDVGRKHDLSVLWVLQKVGDVFVTRMLREFDQVNYTAQEGALNTLMANPAVKRLCIDQTGIGAMLAERQVQKWGHRAEGVTFTLATKIGIGMPLLRLFQDKLVRIPASDQVREDLHKVRKEATAAGNVRLVADSDDAGHADRFWALALAYSAADALKIQLPPPMERKPAGW